MRTAVEVFKIKLIFNSIVKEKINGEVSFTIGLSKLDELINEAKEMERENIEGAFFSGDYYSADYFDANKPHIDPSENYYNKKFKSE